MIKSINLTRQFHQIKLNWTKTSNRVVSSPRISNFSQIIKLIKLIHKDHFYIVPKQKPIDQFSKKKLKSIKTPKFHRFKIFPQCMKHENKWKMRGIMVLPALEDKNLIKSLRENDKKIDWKPWPIEEKEKRGFEKVWKW